MCNSTEKIQIVQSSRTITATCKGGELRTNVISQNPVIIHVQFVRENGEVAWTRIYPLRVQ